MVVYWKSIYIFEDTKQKTNKMNTIEKLQKELETVKLSIKYANSAEIVINAFNNKNEFESICKYTQRKTQLFSNDKIIYFGQFTFNLQDVKIFQSDLKFNNNVNSVNNSEFKKVINAMKFVLKNPNMIEIAFALNKEINK